MGCQIKETQILAERLQLSPSLNGERIENDTERSDGEKIQILAQRLQCSRPPPPPRSLNGEIVENDTNDHKHGINSSMMPFVGRRERRAAVLGCLFEGTGCELRVILTKRSMNLSSHPGKHYRFLDSVSNVFWRILINIQSTFPFSMKKWSTWMRYQKLGITLISKFSISMIGDCKFLSHVTKTVNDKAG